MLAGMAQKNNEEMARELAEGLTNAGLIKVYGEGLEIRRCIDGNASIHAVATVLKDAGVKAIKSPVFDALMACTVGGIRPQ